MKSVKTQPVRRRMKREERRDILLDLAAQMVETQGADALTLVTLAEAANVTKPVIYNQFQRREGLLLALYQRCDARFFAELRENFSDSSLNEETLAKRITESYLLCVQRHGRVYDAAIAALQSYAEFATIKVTVRAAFIRTLTELLQTAHLIRRLPSEIRLISLYGAIEELGKAHLEGQLSADEATREMIFVFKNLLTDDCVA